MGIKPQFSQSDVISEIEKMIKTAEDKIIQSLFFVGEKAVEYARKNDPFKDHTANLRSSISYIVVKDGVEIGSSAEKFQPTTAIDAKSKKSSVGTEGYQNGLEYARQLASSVTNGIALVVVAGMNYALHVERSGYDVLSGAQINSERMFKSIISQLKL